MNKYAEAAKGNIAAAAESGDERLLVAAQTYATLALAYAQDTANLIAVLTDAGPNLHGKIEDFHEPYPALVRELKERLGLA